MENLSTIYTKVFDKQYTNMVEDSAKRFREWRITGKSLNDLEHYQTLLDKNIWYWGKSIYNRSFNDKKRLKLAEAIQIWINTENEMKTDELWIRLFGKLLFNDPGEQVCWP